MRLPRHSRRAALRGWSATSKARAARALMGLPGALVEDAADLAHYALKLVVTGIEVGRDADAGAGTVVHDRLAAQQLARDRFPVLDVQDHHGAALLGTARGPRAQALLLGQLDEPRDLAHRLGAD